MIINNNKIYIPTFLSLYIYINPSKNHPLFIESQFHDSSSKLLGRLRCRAPHLVLRRMLASWKKKSQWEASLVKRRSLPHVFVLETSWHSYVYIYINEYKCIYLYVYTYIYMEESTLNKHWFVYCVFSVYDSITFLVSALCMGIVIQWANASQCKLIIHPNGIYILSNPSPKKLQTNQPYHTLSIGMYNDLQWLRDKGATTQNHTKPSYHT